MAIELTGESVVCSRCGTRYPKYKGNFYSCYGSPYRGVGYITICKNCIDAMHVDNLLHEHSARDSIRQICRKLDLYYDDTIYETIESKSTPKTSVAQYMSRLSAQRYAGMCYDDTLAAENRLWDFSIKEEVQPEPVSVEPEPVVEVEPEPVEEVEEEPVDQALVDFWGTGFTAEDYASLERRYDEWKGSATFDVATEMLVKQICLTELDIARERSEGKVPDKNIQILNSLMGSANLKPAQQQKADEAQALAEIPLGVWLYRYENERPLPEVDDSLKDVNRIRKYVFTWMGHLCKMLDIKNAYSDLYDEAIARYSVQKPEYEGDEDDDPLPLTEEAHTDE